MGPEGVCCVGDDGVCEESEPPAKEEPKEEPKADKPEKPKQQEQPKETKSEPEPAEPEEETPPVGPAEPPEEEKIHATTLKAMKDLYTEKVTSYTFQYGEYQYSIRGDRLKIELDDPAYKRNVELPDGSSKPLFYYDVVYVHLPSKNATAYCEGYGGDLRRQCQKLEIEDIPLDIDYEEYQIALPHEWLMQFSTNATVVSVEPGKYYVRNRAVTRFMLDGYEVYIDPRNGLPIQIIHTGTEEQIDFHNLVINGVPSKEMEHRTYTETL